MITKLLLPNRYKRIGWILLFPSLSLGILSRFFDFQFEFLTINLNKKNADIFLENIINLTDEVALSGVIISLLFIAFTKEKEEDEFISRLRLESLQWAVLINYILLLVATWVIHGLAFIDVMMYNMLTVLLFFIIRFHVLLYRNRSTINS